MKRLIIILAILGAGCASTEPKPLPTEIANQVLRKATDLMIECGVKHAASIDDGVSDASTIALALSQACATEYDGVTKVIGHAYLTNNAQRRLLATERARASSKVDAFLGVVLKYRAASRLTPPSSSRPTKEGAAPV